jgi:hypothetical protein
MTDEERTISLLAWATILTFFAVMVYKFFIF